MTDDANPNGGAANLPSQRPSWYVPLKPLKGDRSVEEILAQTFTSELSELSEEMEEETARFLNQFRIPRDS